MVRKCHSSKCKICRDSATKFQKRRQRSVWYTRNASENEDDKRCNKIWGQYTIGRSKWELSVVFGSVGNKKHKYSCNNRMKCKTSVKCKTNQPKIIPKKPKLWHTNHVKRSDEMHQKKQHNQVEYWKVQNIKMSQMVQKHQKRLEKVVEVTGSTIEYCRMV